MKDHERFSSSTGQQKYLKSENDKLKKVIDDLQKKLQYEYEK